MTRGWRMHGNAWPVCSLNSVITVRALGSPQVQFKTWETLLSLSSGRRTVAI